MASQEPVSAQSPPAAKNLWFTLSGQIMGMTFGIPGGLIMMVVAFIFGNLKCCGLVGRITRERERRRRALNKHYKQEEEKTKQLDHVVTIMSSMQDDFENVTSKLNKITANMESLHQKSLEDSKTVHNSILEHSTELHRYLVEHTTALHNERLSETSNLQVRVQIPGSVFEEKVERTFLAGARKKWRKVGQPISMSGSRVLQLEVALEDDILSELRNLADACTAIDPGVTVQLDNFRVFIRNNGDIEMKTLNESQVPVILHSAYAAGKLTIEGLNLKNATIKAATFDNCITLENVKDPQELDGLEVCTWIVQLPSNILEEVAVYATKQIKIDGHEVSVCSSIVKTQDNNLGTVVRIGLPSLICITYFVWQLSQDGIARKIWSNHGPGLVWIALFLVIVLTQLLPPSLEDMIGANLERFRLMIWAFYFSTRSFLFKEYPKRRIREHNNPLDGEPKKSNNDASNAFQANEECPTNTVVDCLHSLTGTVAQMDKKLSEVTGIMQKELKDDQEDEKESDAEPAIDENWKWQAYQKYATKFGGVKLRKMGASLDENIPVKTSIPFDVVYGLKEELWAERDYVKIFSPMLTEIILRFIPEITYNVSEGFLKVYASTLFHIREKLLEGEKGVLPGNAPSSEQDRVKQIHLDHLLRFMDNEFKDVLTRFSAMERGHHVTWDMLWSFFPTGIQVVYHCGITDEEVLGIVTRTAYKVDREKGKIFQISMKKWDYNCSTWKTYSVSRDILKFDGECGFTNLQTFPLRFKDNPERAEKEFLEKGDVFSYLSMQVRNRFMEYRGLIYMVKPGCPMVIKQDATGKVMVDLGSFSKMNASYPMGSAQPPCEVLRLDNQVELINITSREDRKYAPAMVYGFSFRLKQWGTFQVCGFDEIKFNESAFNALVMPEQKKELLFNLVREYVPNKKTVTPEAGTEGGITQVRQVDPILEKGEGCIILCYGPPGTGKTLTAESISETLHAPLWSLSVSELGTTPANLEKYLSNVLDVATVWGAILLLDEADVYLEQRSSFDLTRTAMTGIFLRNLEYYRGVLFLTTNRVVTFDEAFRSRISMILYYDINPADRRKIWESILDRIELKDTERRLDEWSAKELNGRDIRNVVHRAMILAKGKGQPLHGEDIQQSLNDVVESLEVLASNCLRSV